MSPARPPSPSPGDAPPASAYVLQRRVGVQRRVGGLALLVAVALNLLWALTVPVASSTSGSSYLAAVAGRRSLTTVAAVADIGFLAGVAVGALGLAQVVRHRGVVLAQVGALLVVVGNMCFVALAGAQFSYAEAADPAADRTQALALIERVQGNPGFLGVVAVAFTAGTIGLVLLLVALTRDGWAPAWLIAAVVVSSVVGLAVTGVRAGPVLSSLLRSAALLWAAAKLLRPDETVRDAPA